MMQPAADATEAHEFTQAFIREAHAFAREKGNSDAPCHDSRLPARFLHCEQ